MTDKLNFKFTFLNYRGTYQQCDGEAMPSSYIHVLKQFDAKPQIGKHLQVHPGFDTEKYTFELGPLVCISGKPNAVHNQPFAS